jgi:hypothetical protein
VVQFLHPLIGRRCLDEIDVGRVVHAQQMAAVHQGRIVVDQVIVQVGGMQAILDGAQARRAFRMPVAHVVFAALGMGDVGGIHGDMVACEIQ